MQARRALSLSAVFFTTAFVGLVAACSGDNTIVYVYVEAGTDAGRREGGTVLDDDGGDGTPVCNPTPVPAFTYNAPGKYLGKCSNDQIASLLDACVFNGTVTACDAAKAQNADCSSCMLGNPTDAVGHPLVMYNPQVASMVNQGTCMAAISGESKPTDCSVAFGQIETCAFDACVTSCVDIMDDNAFTTCLQNAIGNECTAGFTTFSSPKCKLEYGDKTYGFCTSGTAADGGALNNLQFYTMISQLVCGTNPNPDSGAPDAGPGDAGTDAGDAGDAGDGGDAGSGG